jgi:hypothetical protein
VALGVVDFLQVGIVGNRLDALLERQHFVVTRIIATPRYSSLFARCIVLMAKWPPVGSI